MSRPSFGQPKAPGSLSADLTAYTIPHRSKFYHPWVIVAVPPTWRDIWAIVRRRYQPKLRITLRLNMDGQARIIKDVWTGDKITKQLYDSSPLLRVPIVKREEAA